MLLIPLTFGEAVQDLNESNPAENLRFVFATGDILDSLSIRSKILDVLTNEPIENALVLLYENRSDTVVRTERPFYFGKTNEEGVTVIENIRADTFKLAVLVDSDGDYLFDQPDREQFGFLDSMIVVSPQSLDTIRVSLFNETIPLRLNDSEVTTYGTAKLIFNRPPNLEDIDSLWNGEGLDFIPEIDKDTLKLWYDHSGNNYWDIFVQLDTGQVDTVNVKPFESTSMDSLKLAKNPPKVFNPTQPINLLFNHPVISWDTSQISFTYDTLAIPFQPTIAKDSINPRGLTFEHSWKEGMPYQIILKPGAITDLFDQPHDTIKLDLNAALIKKYGNINLVINGLDSNLQYIVQIAEKDKVNKSLITSGNTTFSQQLKAIDPGSYSLKVITDFDRDGKWTTGNYDLKRQPEPIFIKEMEQLRANWDLEVIVQLE